MQKHKQNGSVLIVIVMILVIVASIGVVASRLSIVSTNLSSLGIADRMLTQEADVAMYYLKDYGYIADKDVPTGVIGYAKDRQNREIVFCYKGQNPDNFFSPSKASVMYWPAGSSTPNGSSIGGNGYCKSNTSGSDYSSARNAILTQVTIKRTDETAASYTGDPTSNGEVYVAHVTTLMPNMILSNVSKSDIDNCLSTRMSQPIPPSGVTPSASARESVSDCLERLNVPHKTVASKFALLWGLA